MNSKLDGLNPRALEWLSAAAHGGGVLSLCVAITVLEWHEMYEECAAIVEAIEAVETQGRPRGGWRHTEELEQIVLSYPAGRECLWNIGRGLISTIARAMPNGGSRLLLRYKMVHGISIRPITDLESVETGETTP